MRGKLGLEWAGEVVEVGEGVDACASATALWPPDRSRCRNFVVANAEWVYPIPDGMPSEQAAAWPVSLQTMHDAITTNGLLEGREVHPRIMRPSTARILAAAMAQG